VLKIPAWRTFPDQRVTAYQDDQVFWKFYLIPSQVTIRHDAAGKPVFLLIKYAFGDDDRAANPSLPKGGGYLVMDTELRVDPATQASIVAQLQTDVGQIWNQLKAAADAAGQPVQGVGLSVWHRLPGVSTDLHLGVDDILLGLHPDAPGAPPGDAPPKVVISEPTWTTGTFTLSAPQSEALISHRIAAGPVSLVGSNVCSANLDLTAAGATFMERTLVNPDGGGGAQLTPIQAVYDLKFWARVPPVDLRITADSRALFEGIQQLSHNYEGNGCDEDSISQSESQLQLAVDSGLIDVKIDPGTLPVDSDFLQQVRSMGLKVVQDMIKEKFFDKQAAPPPKPDQKDYTDADRDIYVMKSSFDESSMHIEYHESVLTLVEWHISPQGTLQSFLAGMGPDEVKQYVREVNLSDTYFQSLGLNVHAFATWDDDPIAFIECEIHYEGTDAAGQAQAKDQAFTLTKGSPSGTWDPGLIGGKRDYELRWRVGYVGHEPSAWTSWETSSSPVLNLAIGHPGRVHLDVIAGNIDFAAITKRVQIQLGYADTGHGIDSFGTTLELNQAGARQTFQRWIFTPQTQPIRYRTTFFLKNEQQIDGDWQTTTDDSLVVNEPRSSNRLDVQLIPQGRWDDVVQSVVSLRYNDTVHQLSADSPPFVLKSADTFMTWAVFVADPMLRKYQYRIVTAYKDGSADDSGWKDGQGDGPLPVAVRSPARLDVTLVPTLVDFSVTPVVETQLTYDDPANGIHATETFVMTKSDQQVWSIPIKDTNRRSFTSQVSYDTTDGAVVRPPNAGEDDKLVIPRLLVSQLEVLLVPKVVDFVATPVVQVDLSYKDTAGGVSDENTFVFTDATPQSYRLRLRDDGPRTYSLTVTYFLNDGRVVTRAPVSLDQNKVVIPRYVAD
jgi:hypothetical protein